MHILFLLFRIILAYECGEEKEIFGIKIYNDIRYRANEELCAPLQPDFRGTGPDVHLISFGSSGFKATSKKERTQNQFHSR